MNHLSKPRLRLSMNFPRVLGLEKIKHLKLWENLGLKTKYLRGITTEQLFIISKHISRSLFKRKAN
jgi:hypothetical protein